MRTYAMHKYKPRVVMSTGFVIERWSGKAWYQSMCSPYKTMAEVRKHLKDYWWHYTEQNPYRVKDFVPKKVQNHTPKRKQNWNWNDDREMVVKI